MTTARAFTTPGVSRLEIKMRSAVLATFPAVNAVTTGCPRRKVIDLSDRPCSPVGQPQLCPTSQTPESHAPSLVTSGSHCNEGQNRPQKVRAPCSFGSPSQFWFGTIASMHNQTKWNIAVVRFAGFASNLSLSPDEDDVSEYHDIIKLFEDAHGQDLSRFRIAPDQVKPDADSATMASRSSWQTRYPKKNLVEFTYFRGQIRALMDYLMAVLGGRLC